MADKTREAGTTADEMDVTADETPATVDETSATADQTSATVTETDATEETGDEGAGTATDTGETAAVAAETPKAADEAGETGTPVDADTDDATVADSSGDAAKAAGAKPSRIRLAAVILGAVTVVLAGFGVWATLEAHSLRATAAPPNLALSDGAATSAVNRQIDSAVNTVFSYNYADTGATRQAAQGLLTGPAIHQYDTYFALVTKDAPAQKLVVTTRVTNSGVELLTGNRARVLVFANQQDTRAGTRQASYAGALFAVTAVRQGNRWKAALRS